MNPKKALMVCGTGWSGSGALIDLLAEYEGVVVRPDEFDLVRADGLIADFIRLGGRSKFFRAFFKVAVWSQVKNIIKSFPVLNIKYGKRYKFTFTFMEMFLGLKFMLQLSFIKNYEGRLKYSKLFIDSIVSVYRGKNRLAVFDQGVFIEDVRGEVDELFSGFKMVYVVRNPDDQLEDLNGKSVQLFSGLPIKVRFVYGADNTKFALSYLAQTIGRRLDCLLDNSEVVIRFEDLVQNYQVQKNKIEVLLELASCRHSNQFKRFNPTISQKNIGKGERFKLVSPDILTVLREKTERIRCL